MLLLGRDGAIVSVEVVVALSQAFLYLVNHATTINLV